MARIISALTGGIPLTVIAVLALSLFSSIASAQFKCVDSAGKTSFQQVPCPGQQKQQVLDARPANGSFTPTIAVGAASTASTAPGGGTTEQRMVAKYERERHVRDLQHNIEVIQANIEANSARMTSEMDVLSNRKRAANNNLAGATWEQSLSAEMEAVAAKYKALNDVQLSRLHVAQNALAEAQKP